MTTYLPRRSYPGAEMVVDLKIDHHYEINPKFSYPEITLLSSTISLEERTAISSSKPGRSTKKTRCSETVQIDRSFEHKEGYSKALRVRFSKGVTPTFKTVMIEREYSLRVETSMKCAGRTLKVTAFGALEMEPPPLASILGIDSRPAAADNTLVPTGNYPVPPNYEEANS